MKDPDGMLLHVYVTDFRVMRAFLNRLIAADLVRCVVNPGKKSSCEHIATHIHWTDETSWDPCCDHHRISNRQWTGNGRFHPHKLGVAVFADRAVAWLSEIDEALAEKIRVERYHRL